MIEFDSAVDENLRVYEALLKKWQKTINLVSPSTLSSAWQRHFLDSAQLHALLKPEYRTVVDIGSGGGFPGLVLAMMASSKAFHLVESDARKCEFLRTVVRETQLKNVFIHTQRFESFDEVIVPDLITARALADLSQLFSYVMPWTDQNPKLEMVFMKGRRYAEEIDNARKLYKFECDVISSSTESDSAILKINSLTTL